MKRPTLDGERRKQARLETLGTNQPLCGGCGESDWRTFEEHHLAGRKNDPRTVPLCASDHRRVTDMQKDHPVVLEGADPLLATAGELMLNLADILTVVIDKLLDYGATLIARASSAETIENGDRP